MSFDTCVPFVSAVSPIHKRLTGEEQFYPSIVVAKATGQWRLTFSFRKSLTMNSIMKDPMGTTTLDTLEVVQASCNNTARGSNTARYNRAKCPQ